VLSGLGQEVWTHESERADSGDDVEPTPEFDPQRLILVENDIVIHASSG
jgi:hypothetical protein